MLKNPGAAFRQHRPELIGALLLSPFLSLGTVNHLLDFWVRSRLVQVGLLAAFTLLWLLILTVLLGVLLPVLRRMPTGSQVLLLVGSLGISAFLLVMITPSFTPRPPSLHDLRIIVPARQAADAPSTISVLEFVDASGKKHPLHLFEQSGEWSAGEDGSLTHASAQPAELHYSFYDKWNQPVELLLLAGPEAGKVELILDGASQPVDLGDSYPNNRVVVIKTGSTQPLWNFLLLAADFLLIFTITFTLATALLVLFRRSELAALVNTGEVLAVVLLYLLSAWLGSAYIQQVRLTNLVDVRPLEYSNLVFGLVFGLVIVAAYAVFRLGMKRFWALLGALAFLSSSLHLYALTMLHREYIRALFTLAVLFLLGLILLGKNSARRLYLLSALTGVMIGWGLHFRQDLLLYFVPYLVLVLVFLPGFKWDRIKVKAIAVTLCLVMVVAAQFLAGGAFHLEGTSVAAIGGLMEPLTYKMAVQDPIYNLGSIWVMEYADSVPILHRDLLGAGTNYIQAVLLTFPADILLRAYASIIQVLDLPFIFVLPPLGVTSALVEVFYQVRSALLNFPPGFGAFLALVTLILIAIKNLRIALFYAFLMLFLSAYPAVDFQARHFFQLQIFTWFNLGFLLDRFTRVAGRFLSAPRKDLRALRQSLPYTDQEWKSIPRRAGIFALGGVLVLLLPLFSLRSMQQNTVAGMLLQYQEAKKEEIPLTLLPQDGGYVLWTNEEVFRKPPSAGITYGELLMAEFDPQGCDFTTLWPRLQYNYDTESIRGTRQDLSSYARITLDPSVDKVQYYFQSVFANSSAGWQGHPGYTYFAGIRLPASASACLKGIYRVEVPQSLPILLNAAVSEGWENTPLYQRSQLLEPGKQPDSPAAMPGTRAIPVTPEQVAITKAPFQFGPSGQWQADGYTIPDQGTAAMEKISPYSVYQTLLETVPVQLKPGEGFTAHGQVLAGGVLFELLQDGTVHDRLLVTGPVPFNVRLEAQQEGEYTLRMSSHIDKFSSYETRLKVDDPAWVVKE